MKILHATNRHRGGGGADNAWDRSLSLLDETDLSVRLFERSSRELSQGILGKVRAFYSGVYAPDGVKGFESELASYKPDIVHVHELYPYISPWILPKCRKAKIPVVMTVYDYRLTCPIATHYDGNEICHRCLHKGSHWSVLRNCRDNYLESLAFGLRHAIGKHFNLFLQNIDHFIVLTEFCADWLTKQLGIESSRISVVPCVVDVPDKPVQDPSKGAYVAFAGRFVKEKGVEVLAEACRQAGVPLKLAGRASEHPAIRPGDDIECVMSEGRSGIEDFYRNSKMVVVPSIWYETFGLVAAEASALGLPVIASNIGALAETVLHEKTGLLFEPGNVSALKEAILRLWNNPELSREYGQNGRMRVSQDFTEKRNRDAFLGIYQTLVASGIS